MGLTAFYGPALKNEEGVAVLKAAYDAGCRHFDTAQVYQQYGEQVPGAYRFNEELVGAFIKTIPDGDRAALTIATKFFPRREGEGDNKQFKYSFEMLNEATDESLERLGVKTIDLYYLHRMYPEDVVKPEVIAADMKKLISAGKIRSYGFSEASPSTIRRAHAVHPMMAIQQEWSLFARDLEVEVVPTCKELGIEIVAYSPIARGMLSGALTTPPKDWRASVPYLTEENMEANKKLVQAIEELAAAKNTTAAQICLAWVQKKGGIPIPGTTKEARARSNHQSTEIMMTSEDMAALEALGEKVKGLRGSESYMSSTFHTN